MAFWQSIIAFAARLGLVDSSGSRGHTVEEAAPLAFAFSRVQSSYMDFPGLRGRSILVVEDEALIGYDIRLALEAAGASVTSTTTKRHALILIENDGLAAAIIDHALSDGDSTEVCAGLKARGIPYISYSGLGPAFGADPSAPYIGKPAPMDQLLKAVEALLIGRPHRIS